jgi:hypothetical protein
MVKFGLLEMKLVKISNRAMNAERRGLSRFMRKAHKPRQKRPDSLAKSARRPVIAGVMLASELQVYVL